MFSVLLFALGLSATWACCPPKTWESTVYELTTFDATQMHRVSAHDDSKKREGFYFFVNDRQVSHVIKDYANMIMVHYTPETKACNARAFNETFLSLENCQNPIASGITEMKYIQPHKKATVGLSPETLNLTRLSFKLDGKKFLFGMTKNEDGTCFPVYTTVTFPVGTTNVFVYHNTEAKVSSEGILDIPEVCFEKIEEMKKLVA